MEFEEKQTTIIIISSSRDGERCNLFRSNSPFSASFLNNNSLKNVFIPHSFTDRGVTVFKGPGLPISNLPILGVVMRKVAYNISMTYINRILKSPPFLIQKLWIITNPVIWPLLKNHISPNDYINYDIVDDWQPLVGDKTYFELELDKSEKDLISQSKQVTFVSEKLFRKFNSSNQINLSKIVRNGVDVKLFTVQKPMPDELVGLHHPIVGFVGTLGHWIDINLFYEIAKKILPASMVIVGPIETDVSNLKSLTNVHLLGRQPYDKVIGFLQNFDLVINPFKTSETSMGADYIKLYECLAARKLNISTALPQSDIFGNTILQASSKSEFISLVENFLSGKTKFDKELAFKVAQQNTWESRAREFLHLIEN